MGSEVEAAIERLTDFAHGFECDVHSHVIDKSVAQQHATDLRLVLSKLHQDAGNEELVAQARDYIDGYHGKTDLRVGPLMLLHMVERLADALERGSQVGDGWVIVPREPTPAMLLASEFLATGASRDDVIADYRAMLAAAPAHGGGE